MLPTLYTMQEVSDRLKLSRDYLNRLIRERKLACVPVTRNKKLFTEEQIQEFIESRTLRLPEPAKRVDTTRRDPISSPRKGGGRTRWLGIETFGRGETHGGDSFMAIIKRGGKYCLDFRPFKREKIGLALPTVRTKAEAIQIEAEILLACRSWDYGRLSQAAREATVRMFRNRNWEFPDGLVAQATPRSELSLLKACELFMKYPATRSSNSYERYEQCIKHLVEQFGPERPIKSIWVPEIRQYIAGRLSVGASPSTINREKGTLSKICQALIEMQLIDTNPARLVPNLSQKCEERQVYLSSGDVTRILDRCPPWFRPIGWTAYYTGMRRGEILDLTRDRDEPVHKDNQARSTAHERGELETGADPQRPRSYPGAMSQGLDPHLGQAIPSLGSAGSTAA